MISRANSSSCCVGQAGWECPNSGRSRISKPEANKVLMMVRNASRANYFLLGSGFF
jgi:hypothetical protein